MPANTTFSLLRRSLVVVAFLGLVGLFFALHFLLYIPKQEQLYNNKIFRILSEISRDFTLRIEGAVNKEVKTGNKNSEAAQITKQLVASQPDADLREILLEYFYRLKDTRDSSANTTVRYSLQKGSIQATVTRKSDNKQATAQPTLNLPIDSMLRPNYEQLHHGLFKLLMLVKRNTDSLAPGSQRKLPQDMLLYHTGELNTRFAFNGDSLFKDKQYGQFATVHEVLVQGQKFQAFSLPFQLPDSDDELLLIGWVPYKVYRAATAEFSVTAILGIGVLLAIVMLSLPVIKLALCSRKEKVSINEVRLLMVVFLATPFLVTLAAGAICTYQYADQVSTNTLAKLHKTIQQKLQEEVTTAYQQLDEYECLLSKAASQNATARIDVGANTKDSFTKAMNKWLFPRLYKNLTDIFWANGSGMQVGKWFFSPGQVSYLDLGKRTFFQEIKKHATTPAPGSYRYIEPTISWSTGTYTVNMVKGSSTLLAPRASIGPDRAGEFTAVMAGIAARLYSVCDPILPKGYQFAYIDRKGRILFHSQTERALHENLLEEAGYHRALMAAINNNDSILLRSVEMYDHNIKMLVSPSQLMPQAFVVTYFQERERNLFVLHIMMFAFFCTCGTLFLFLLFHLLKKAILKTGQVPNIFQYPTTWMQPAASKMGFYRSLANSQFILLALQPIFALTGYDSAHWDELLLMQCTLLPFEVATCYYLLRKRYDYERNGAKNRALTKTGNQRLIGFYTAFIIPIIGLLFWKLDQDASIVWLLASLLLSAAMGPLLGLYMPVTTYPAKAVPMNKHSRAFEKKYLSTLLFAIVLIAVVPTLGFLLYGFKQEKQLKIEAEQVTAAQAIAARQRLADSLVAINQDSAPQDYKAMLDYKAKRKLDTTYGIYLPLQTLYPAPASKYLQASMGERPTQSHIYRHITRFLFLPDDHADFFNNNQLLFWNPEEQQTLNYISADPSVISSFQLKHKKDSPIYPEISSLVWNMEFLLLGIALVLFFMILSQLIRGMVHRIFLLNLFPATTASLDASQVTEAENNRHRAQDNFYQAIAISKAEQDEFGLPMGNITHDQIARLEGEVITGKRDYADILHLEFLLCPAYEKIWAGLSKPEQLVLYDFALDGITNYRNSDTIYKLYQAGLLVRKPDGHLELMNQSFRRYLLSKAGSEEVIKLEQQFKADSSWKNLKSFCYMLFFAVMVFLFATQQDLSNKVIAIISGLATVIPLMIRLFDRNVPSGGDKS